MYNVYRRDVGNFVIHIYAKNLDSAQEIFDSINDNLVDAVHELVDDFEFDEELYIQEVLSMIEDYDIRMIEETDLPLKAINQISETDLFRQFDKTICKQFETMGGYVLDYYSPNGVSKGKMQGLEAFSFISNVYEHNMFFDYDDYMEFFEIEELLVKNNKSLNIPDYNSKMKIKLKLKTIDQKRELTEYAIPRLDIKFDEGVKDELGRTFYLVELDGIELLCRLLNYFRVNPEVIDIEFI